MKLLFHVVTNSINPFQTFFILPSGILLALGKVLDNELGKNILFVTWNSPILTDGEKTLNVVISNVP